MTFAIFGLACILACWKWGDWRRWELYYSTVLYMIIGDLTTDFILFKHPLWSFGPFVEKYPVVDIAVMVILYPATVVLFLSFLPKTAAKQALYCLMWAGIYSAVELVATSTCGFSYHNGWTIWYSVLFDLVMFPLLALHYKKPLLVWPISAVLCFALLWWFRVPLMS